MRSFNGVKVKSWDIFPVLVQIKFFGSSVLGDD